MRCHAVACSGLYMPAQPGVMRPSRETSVISVMTSAAPPIARLPRWTRCQSSGTPSSAEYWHIGETTTRLTSTMSRRRNGVNIGGGGGSAGTVTPLLLGAGPGEQRGSPGREKGGEGKRVELRGARII